MWGSCLIGWELGLWILGAIALSLFLRDWVYRLFFIYPKTNWTGSYAALIEENHIYRWVLPAIVKSTKSVDVIFAGNSHVMDGIDPHVIQEETGYCAYNMALYGVPSPHTIELLIKYNRYPKIIFIDFSSRYSTYIPQNSHIQQMAEQALAMQPFERLRYATMDRIHWFLPSLFVPKPYRGMLRRAYEKVNKFRQTGYMAIGRYAPFRLFTSFEWKLDKSTNHRIVRRVRSKTHWETQYEKYLLRKCLEDAPKFCDVNSAVYQLGMKQTESLIQQLLQYQVQVVLMRMPLCKRVINYENANFSTFFADVQAIADRLGLDYLDLNQPDIQEKIGKLGFYNDGHHLLHSSSQKVSRYLASIIQKKLNATSEVTIG